MQSHTFTTNSLVHFQSSPATGLQWSHCNRWRHR